MAFDTDVWLAPWPHSIHVVAWWRGGVMPMLSDYRPGFAFGLFCFVLFCLKGGLLRCRQGVVNSRQARRPPLLPYNRARQGDGASDAGQLRPGHESDQPVATEEGVLRLTRPNPRKPIASSGHDPQGSRLYGPATKQLYSFANYGRMYRRRTVTS